MSGNSAFRGLEKDTFLNISRNISVRKNRFHIFTDMQMYHSISLNFRDILVFLLEY